MSLINDALKKAQRQRTGDHRPTSQPPMPGGGAASLRSDRDKSGANPQLLLLGAGALLGVLIAAGAMIFFRGKSDPTQAPATTQVASAPAPKSAEQAAAQPAAAPVTFSSSAKSTEPTLVVKTDAAPALATNAAASAAAPSTSATTTPAMPTVVAPPAPSEPPAPSLRMIEAIEALRVAGIRAGTGSDAKVLMNDRVYRIGDTVDHALGIKLTAVTANSLSFRDASGATYTRNF